jgi:hypothetical protein
VYEELICKGKEIVKCLGLHNLPSRIAFTHLTGGDKFGLRPPQSLITPLS